MPPRTLRRPRLGTTPAEASTSKLWISYRPGPGRSTPKTVLKRGILHLAAVPGLALICESLRRRSSMWLFVLLFGLLKVKRTLALSRSPQAHHEHARTG